MKNVKKLFLLMAVVVTAVVCFAVSASALDATGQCGNNVYWNYNAETGELVISGTGAMEDYDGKNTPFYNSDVKSVIIENGVTSIGDYAFYGCTSLRSITIPDSVTSIGEGAFACCTSLTSITIPAGVTSIGEDAFYGCSGIKNVYAPAIESWINIDFGNEYSNPGYYEEPYFDGERLTVITIPDGTKSIKNYAFYGCKSLTSITIPDSVTSIGKRVFYGCTGLESITIPDSVTSIGVLAFYNCSGLKNVYAPAIESWINIDFGNEYSNPGYYVEPYFNGERLTEITIPDGTKSIKNYAFYGCKSLTSITIPDGVTDIGAYAFYKCTSLTNITIPKGVTSIGDYAFASCSLRSITIPKGVTSIGDCAFYCCTGLESITIPDSVTSIGDYAFAVCTSLTSITIPDSVTSIGDCAFYWCTGLESITIPDSVTSIGDYAFAGCESYLHIYGATGSVAESYAKRNKIKFVAVSHFHSYTGTITKTATCFENGTIEYSCSCGNSYTELTAKISHSYSTEYTVDTPATCTTAGSKSQHCTRSGCTEKSNITEIPATGHTYSAYETTKNPTCTKSGQKQRICSTCENIQTKSISKLGHSYEKVTTTKATLEADGRISNICTVCDYIASKSTRIYRPTSFTLSTTEYTYNGTERKPRVTVKDSAGSTLVEGTDYTVGYESGRILPGKYTVKITFKGNYDGVQRLYFTIRPRVTTEITATQTITTITLTWKKVTGADIYRIYKLNPETEKYDLCALSTSTSCKISELSSGTVYKFKIRANKDDEGEIYGSFSSEFETATKTKTPSITEIYSKTTGKAVVKWSGVDGETGYQLYYSTSKDGDFTKVKSYAVDKLAGSKTELESGKTYYFKVRAYTKTASGTVYSKWSTVKSVKVK